MLKVGYSSTALNGHFLEEHPMPCSFSTQDLYSAGRENSGQIYAVISKEVIIVIRMYCSQFSWQHEENNDRPQ
jgi:hypothetical protein